MRPCDVYVKELSTLSRGHAVHNPRRDKFQSGRGLRPAVDVGDVAYDLDGMLIRLFNCLLPRNQQDEDCVFPDDFEILELADSRSIHGQPARIIVKENHSRPGPFYSKGVQMVKVEASVSAASSAGARIAFRAHHEQGAVLLTSGPIRTRQSPNRPAFEKYLVKHFDALCLLLQSQELDVQPEELMLITGVDTTAAWSNLSFTEGQIEGDFGVNIPSASPIEIRVAASMELSRAQSVTRDSGPNPEDMEIKCALSSDANASDIPKKEMLPNQVVFVRALRGKRRLFRGLKIIANADPEGLSGGPSGDGDSSVLSIENVEDRASREDFLTPVLDLILANSDVDMAVVHDDDYDFYNQYVSRQADPSAPVSLVSCRGDEGAIFGVLDVQASSAMTSGYSGTLSKSLETTSLEDADIHALGGSQSSYETVLDSEAVGLENITTLNGLEEHLTSEACTSATPLDTTPSLSRLSSPSHIGHSIVRPEATAQSGHLYTTQDMLSPGHIDSALTSLDRTIIFGLLERSQFAHNPRVYQRGAFPELVKLGFEGSWVEWFLKETESFHAKARRYTSPDECPFTPLSELPGSVLPTLAYPSLLHPNRVNASKSILAFYTRSIVPRITAGATHALAAFKRSMGVIGEDEQEDDGNYGSAATLDVALLQAMSKRVHYGKFLSESEFVAAPASFIPHIRNLNTEALEELITKPELETRLLQSLRQKAQLYAQGSASDGEVLPSEKGNFDVDIVVDLYESYMLPLMKEVEVDYLLQRLEGLSTERIEALLKGARVD
ncbi:unnamed protein product [Peniophora sp. CBMAI 1063]|nr:unnamed protein product [Peniophora sp. CBMAI 1063]